MVQDPPDRAGGLYLSALQPDSAGVEAEGGLGWVELKVADQAKLSAEWTVYAAGPGAAKAALCGSSDLVSAVNALVNGSTIRLHPSIGYPGADDLESGVSGGDGKFDIVCGVDAALPLSGSIWIEDGDGNVADIVSYCGGGSGGMLAGDETDLAAALADAVEGGEWPSAEAVVCADSERGFMRLSDAACEGNDPSQWLVSGGPSVVFDPVLSVSAAAVSPSSAVKGEDVSFSLSAGGLYGASVESVTFDFSALKADAQHLADVAPQTLSVSVEGVYSCVLHTSGIVPGNYEIAVAVKGVGAPDAFTSASLSVRDKPMLAFGSPVLSYAPSTAAAPGKTFTLSIPVTASGTAVTALTLKCAALTLSQTGLLDAGGNAVFTVDTTGYAEGTYELAARASGDGVEDASAAVVCTVQSSWFVAGGDMESAIEDSSGFKPSPATGYVLASDSPQNVRSGLRSLHISGTPSSNGYVFASQNSCMPKGGFSKIVFYLKGFVSGKSLSVNVYTDSSSYRCFNLGKVSESKTVLSAGSNSYTGAVSLTGWTKISLDVADMVPAGRIAFKCGSSGNYDLYLDDIEYE
jgi:hypothetical protein